MSPDRPKEFTYFIRIYFTYDDMVSIPCFELKERYTEAESKDYGGYIRALFFNSTKFSVGLATRLTKPAINRILFWPKQLRSKYVWPTVIFNWCRGRSTSKPRKRYELEFYIILYQRKKWEIFDVMRSVWMTTRYSRGEPELIWLATSQTNDSVAGCH